MAVAFIDDNLLTFYYVNKQLKIIYETSVVGFCSCFLGVLC